MTRAGVNFEINSDTSKTIYKKCCPKPRNNIRLQNSITIFVLSSLL